MSKRITFASLAPAVLTALLSMLLILSLPAAGFAEPKHDKGQERRQKAASDHDGDADSDEATTEEDEHVEETDADDNQHPSGKDRSAEYGGSGNQGKAESNPDDSKGPMRYECNRPDETELGDDKPDGSGGCDPEDQDGNNGCGNDDDFDDDSNGWCGPRVTKKIDTPPTCIENCAPCSTTNCPTLTPTLTVTVDCLSVTVTATKHEISNVEVFFADGTSQRFEGLSGYSWSMTFTKPVSSVTAKASTTSATATAPTECGTTTGGGGVKFCPDGVTPMPSNGKCDDGDTCPDGSPMPTNGKCDGTIVEGSTLCPDGSEMPSNGKCPTTTTTVGDCPAGMVSGDGGECIPTTVDGEHMVDCPASAVMATSEGGCPEDDDVLGGTIAPDDDDVAAGGIGPDDGTVPDATAADRSETAAAPGSAALPFTGAGLFLLLLAGLALIGGGIKALRRTK